MPISYRFLGFWKTAEAHISGSNVRHKFTRVAQFLIILVIPRKIVQVLLHLYPDLDSRMQAEFGQCVHEYTLKTR